MVLKYKTKGAYSTPDPLNWAKSIGEMQPAGWHRDWSAVIVPRAAVAHMVQNIDIETYIRACTNPYDFMCGVKTKASDSLYWGSQKMGKNTRYYITHDGAQLVKHGTALGPVGAYKKGRDVPDHEYARVMKETGGAWDERVCTKNKSKYELRETQLQASYNVTVCNDVNHFRFENINYGWYIQEAVKLVI